MRSKSDINIGSKQTNKYKDHGDNDPDSDSEIEEGKEDKDESDQSVAHETGGLEQPNKNTGGSQTECKICYAAEINTLLLLRKNQ